MKRLNCYIRRVGGRICATFDDGQFYMTESPEDDAALMKAAGVDSFPAEATLPATWKEVAALCCGP